MPSLFADEPDLLEREAFVELIRRLSDPPSGPASADNLMTNEDSIASVMDQAGREVPRDTVYLGVGPDQNFSLIAATRPDSAFILDFRKKNQLLHFLHRALLHVSNDQVEYLAHFWARSFIKCATAPINANRREISAGELICGFKNTDFQKQLFENAQAKVSEQIRLLNYVSADELTEIRRIHARLAGAGLQARFLALKMYPQMQSLVQALTRSGKPGHWLGSDQHFQTIRELQTKNRIIPIVADWADSPKNTQSSAFQRLSDWLISNQKQVGCIYISDVEFFLMRTSIFDKYIENLGQLPIHEEARIIRTSTREIKHPERLSGQSSTTIVRPLRQFIDRASSGKIKTLDDLFA